MGDLALAPRIPPTSLLITMNSLHMLKRLPNTLLHIRRASSAAKKNDFSRPGPPPLSRAEQREFEELQRRVNAPATAPISGTNLAQPEEASMHPDLRKTPKPAFEGETNPQTGEIGGPKREPLTHGESTLCLL